MLDRGGWLAEGGRPPWLSPPKKLSQRVTSLFSTNSITSFDLIESHARPAVWKQRAAAIERGHDFAFDSSFATAFRHAVATHDLLSKQHADNAEKAEAA